MSLLKDLSGGVTNRCREEISRLGLKGVTFCAVTGLPKQVFSAVSNGVNAAPTGFISALCRNYPADVSYIITGVPSSRIAETISTSGDMSPAVNNGTIDIKFNTDSSRVSELETEIRHLKELLAEKERLIDVLMRKL